MATKGEKTYTMEDLQKMTVKEVNEVFTKKPKIRGTAIVRRADGSAKYDNKERFEEGIRKLNEEIANER